MGVMACNRKDCESIMCDTYVDDIGYICNDCKEEFKNYLKAINKKPDNKYEIKRLLFAFMSTDKNSFNVSGKMTVDEFFNHYTS